MKNFEDFKETMSDEKITQICNSRIQKIAEIEKTLDFEDSVDEFVWQQRSQMIGFIFDFLEEYHKWLNG